IRRDDDKQVLTIDKKMTNRLTESFGKIGRVFVELGLVEAKRKRPVKGSEFQKIEDTFTTFFITPLIGQINFGKLSRPKTDLLGLLLFERLVFDPIKTGVPQVTRSRLTRIGKEYFNPGGTSTVKYPNLLQRIL